MEFNGFPVYAYPFFGKVLFNLIDNALRYGKRRWPDSFFCKWAGKPSHESSPLTFRL